MRTAVMGLLALALCGVTPASGAGQPGRTFVFGAGPAVRVFTLREPSGVILVNRITAPHGMRVVVDARLPGVAGARVATWGPGRAATSCSRRGTRDVCTQHEEWCPMPAAVWHFRLVKRAGSAGSVRFDYVVAPPPR